MDLKWIYKDFGELTNRELYDVMMLRQEVFIVEQDCPYMDADGKDIPSHHLLGFDNEDDLVAYSRIVPPGTSYKEPSIGRIVTSQKVRRKGAGKLLMIEGIKRVMDHFGELPIRISAQCYLIPFYESFGFNGVGESYLEDDIPHMEMLRLP